MHYHKHRQSKMPDAKISSKGVALMANLRVTLSVSEHRWLAWNEPFQALTSPCPTFPAARADAYRRARKSVFQVRFELSKPDFSLMLSH